MAAPDDSDLRATEEIKARTISQLFFARSARGWIEPSIRHDREAAVR